MIKICNLKDIESNKINLFKVNGKKYLVIKINNKISVLNNICLHKGAPLEKGRIVNNEIECPWHGCKWNIFDGESIHNRMKIETYDYLEQKGELFLKNV